MGIYTNTDRFNTNNDVYDYASEIAANEAYTAAVGCAQILLDNQKNDRALFESVIYNDVAEVNAFYNEGVQVVNENAITNVFKKIIEMFKKLLAKIKGVFMSVITRISTALSDGDKLVKKYDKKIQDCKNWTKFALKNIRKPKEDNIFDAINTTFPFAMSNTFAVNTANDLTAKIGDIGTAAEIKDMDAADVRKNVMRSYVKDGIDTSKENFRKSVMDSLFNDAAEFKVSASSDISATWIKGAVEGKNKALSNVKATAKKAEQLLNKIIGDLVKLDKKLSSIASGDKANSTKVEGEFTSSRSHNTNWDADSDKNKPEGTYKDDSVKTTESGGKSVAEVQAYVQALNKVASAEQDVVARVTAEIIEVYKFTLAQGRKIYAAAARYASSANANAEPAKKEEEKPAEKKEEAKQEAVDFQDSVYLNTLAECIEEEFYMNMEAL